MKRTELYNKHKGATIAVLGGAPCLHDDYKQVQADVYIGCNHHAVQAYECDYVTALDGATADGIHIFDLLAEWRDKFISPYKRFGAYHIDLIAKPTPDHFINTGILAVFIAQQMGASLIHLCGIEFYQGDGVYFHGNGNVRDSNKTPEYAAKCINRLRQINAPIGFNRLGL